MKVVVQRVSEASVTVDASLVSQIGPGLMILVGISVDDDSKDVAYLVGKLLALRVFPDELGVMNLSVLDKQYDLLVVSQFTLQAATKKGNRPSYIAAARPEQAIPLYEEFCSQLSSGLGKSIAKGVFGADMKVALVNDGPVTIIIDSKNP